MKIADLREAPVVSHEYRDDRKSDASSFNAPDDLKVASQKWRDTLVGKWRDPHKFRLVFVDVGDRFKDMIKKYSGSVTQETVRDKIDANYVSNPDVINMLFYSNELVKNVGYLTPWILAHRIAHAMETKMVMSGFTGTLVDGVLDLSMALPITLKYYGDIIDPSSPDVEVNDHYGLQKIPSFRDKRAGIEANPAREFSRIFCSFKSANNLESPDEFVYELMAQKIVTGKITLNRVDGRQDVNAKVEELERNLNSAATDCLNASVGSNFIF